MRLAKITLAFALVFCVTALPLKLFLIGGASPQTATLIYSQLAKTVPGRAPQPNSCSQDWSLTTCPRIAVATSAADNQTAGNQAFNIDDTSGLGYRSLFLRFGIAPKHISVHRDNYIVHGNISSPQGAANLKIIQQADIIFFNGGDQARHIRSWLNDDASPSTLLELIKKRAFNFELVLAGTSAGSMIWDTMTFGGGDSFGTLYYENTIGLAPKTVKDGAVGGTGLADTRNGTKSLQYDHNGAKMPAFNFIDFTVDTHFNARGRLGRLPPALVDLRQDLGIGIDENTSFYYNNGIGTVYGWNGVTIVDLKQAIIKPQPYYTASGIIGHYLTAGDSYDFNSKLVFSNKTVIKSPYYVNPTDSSDILKAYQATLIETRVVDQKALYNLGSTKTPSGFPKNTPKFEIKFYRDGQSKGYFQDSKYTVFHILYDYSYGANVAGLKPRPPTHLTSEQHSQG